MSVNTTKIFRFLFLLAMATLIVILGSIPVQIAITKDQFPEPQAIFMLGGNLNRDRATAQFAQKHPELPILISVGFGPTREIFAQANIDPQRLHYDQRATDTVTNFTTMIKPFQERQLRHVYLITSDYHMRRSLIIATIVFGSQGIVVAPIEVPSPQEPESLLRGIRDLFRSLLWLFTGRTGASLYERLFLISLKNSVNPSSLAIK